MQFLSGKFRFGKATGFLLLALYGTVAQAAVLEMSIQGLRSGKGTVVVALFQDEKSFPDKGKPFRELVHPLEGKTEGVVVRLEGLPEGEYAAALFHDENGNQVMEKDWIGVPSEGFGFTANPRIVFGAPSFSRSRIEVKGEITRTVVEMKHF